MSPTFLVSIAAIALYLVEPLRHVDRRLKTVASYQEQWYPGVEPIAAKHLGSFPDVVRLWAGYLRKLPSLLLAVPA